MPSGAGSPTESDQNDKFSQYTELLHLTHDIIIVIALNGAITFWNKAAEDNYGWTQEEVLGKNCHQLLRTESDVPIEEIKSLLLKQRIWEGELLHRRRDGTRILVVSRWAIDREERNAATIIFEVNSNITEEKRLGDQLIESEMRFREMFEQAGAGMAQVNLEGRFLRVNDRVCELTGYTREEMLQRYFGDLCRPEDHAADLGLWERLLANEIPRYFIDKRYTRKDGSTVWVRVTVSLVRDVTGAPKYGMRVVSDISELKRAEETIKQQQETLRQLSTPILPLADGLLVAPLVGTFNSGRAAQLTTQLLNAVRQGRARAVVVDLTGVPEMDSAAATRLVQCAESARLLGAQVIVSGISRKMAATLVDLHEHLASIHTTGDLRSGIEEAARLIGLKCPKPHPAS